MLRCGMYVYAGHVADIRIHCCLNSRSGGTPPCSTFRNYSCGKQSNRGHRNLSPPMSHHLDRDLDNPRRGGTVQYQQQPLVNPNPPVASVPTIKCHGSLKPSPSSESAADSTTTTITPTQASSSHVQDRGSQLDLPALQRPLQEYRGHH